MKIERPILAICVYLGIGFLLLKFGVRDGTLVLADVAAGLVIYAGACSLLGRRQ